MIPLVNNNSQELCGLLDGLWARFLRHALRILSYLFLAICCLAALVLSAVIVGSPHQTVRRDWLPWQGEAHGEALGAALAIFG